MSAEEGAAILVTTHSLDEAEHCHRVVLLHAGRLVASGPVDRLKEVLADRAILEVTCPRPFDALQALERQTWVLDAAPFGARLHVSVRDEAEGRDLLSEALAREGNVPFAVERIVPSFEDVFLHIVEREERRAATPGGAA
jgi:ABC-2 type transport system ATP-binding protein